MSEGRIAGSDTREAIGTTTVRRARLAALLIAAPGWAAAFGAPAAWGEHVAMPSALAPWVAITLVAAGAGAAILGWRRPLPAATPERPTGGWAPGAGSAAIIAGPALMVAVGGDAELGALVMPLVPMLAGWTVGRAARIATSACVSDVHSAASGIVVRSSLFGLFFAGHIALVGTGSGLPRAAGWTAAYAIAAIVFLVRAARALDEDRRRVASRSPVADVAEGVMSEYAFSVEDVTVAFGANTVLRDASLRARAGEVMALVGGNGAGKSTLLRVAAGMIVPASGRVLVAGEDVSTLWPEERATAGLAFVSGARPVFPDMTVLENLRVAAYRTHLTPRSFAVATEAVLDLVPALARRRRAKAGVLSGGEQRLLAVAQSLYRRPIVLLADELSLGLDLQARLAVLDLLRLLADQGVSVVVVDHDLPSLLPRSDRAALLTAGSIRMFDRPEDILKQRMDLLPATFLAGASG